MNIKERLRICKGKKKDVDVIILYLNNSITKGSFGGLFATFTNLTTLHMVNCGLVSFEKFPKLPRLLYLDVSNNQFTDFCLHINILVKNAKSLERLIIEGNNFSNINTFSPLKKATNLIEIDLSFCHGLGELKGYRKFLFETIPTLKILNGCESHSNSDEEDEDGDFFGIEDEHCYSDTNEDSISDEKNEDEEHVETKMDDEDDDIQIIAYIESS
ncbi:unnamed protein product [Caenorhabditis angaria]|uniref:Uncharacterized protein n=1 Tax=Caenorhabditis angaria TaxID=860376 RepID=A0A9P1MUQ3_9PELO|nr:unnamed protein product [Caenorhabditis angaria]